MQTGRRIELQSDLHTESSSRLWSNKVAAMPHDATWPYVLGIGGSTRTDSSSERALIRALDAAASFGARTVLLTAQELDLPMYAPSVSERTDAARAFVNEVARADGLVISSPAYHGGVSGLLKNAIDYLEDLRDAERPYLDGRAVGCIVCANGWQGTVSALMELRAIVHSLRGWPTPLGVTINSQHPVFDRDGGVADREVASRLEILGRQVVEFARLGAVAR